MVFRTHSLLAVPRFEMKTLIKYFLTKKLSPEKTTGVMLSENLWNWPDYYIFVRR